jgi:hypothetical protein
MSKSALLALLQGSSQAAGEGPGDQGIQQCMGQGDALAQLWEGPHPPGTEVLPQPPTA